MTDKVRDGGMNLLGKVDVWDNLIRIKSESIVQELILKSKKLLQEERTKSEK